MCNADPVDYLIVPRLLATSLMMICLTIYAVLVAEVTGLLTAWFGFDVHPATFLSLRLVDSGDLISGLGKAFTYGCAIPIIAGYAGLQARGGSEGVGTATTWAVVSTSFAVIVLDFLLSSAVFVLF